MTLITLPIVVDVDRDAISAAVESIAALNAAVNAAQTLDQGLPDGFVLPDDVDDLVRLEPVHGSASEARELHHLQIQPSDRHLESVSAIAAHGDAYSVRVIHGWPVLVAKGEADAVAGSESIS